MPTQKIKREVSDSKRKQSDIVYDELERESGITN